VIFLGNNCSRQSYLSNIFEIERVRPVFKGILTIYVIAIDLYHCYRLLVGRRLYIRIGKFLYYHNLTRYIQFSLMNKKKREQASSYLTAFNSNRLENDYTARIFSILYGDFVEILCGNTS
jgi:hypothetical protein